MAIKTYFWKNRHGQIVPLAIMDDLYIRNCYRRCVEVILGNKATYTEGESRHTYEEGTELTKECAAKWAILFEEEAKKRNIRLSKPDKDTYHIGYGARLRKKRGRILENIKFDNKFK